MSREYFVILPANTGYIHGDMAVLNCDNAGDIRGSARDELTRYTLPFTPHHEPGS